MRWAWLILVILALCAGLVWAVFFLEDMPQPGGALPVDAPLPGVSSPPPKAPPPLQESDADLFEAIEAARQANPDAVGWLTVPGTGIDGAVVQSYDNHYYLRRDEKRQPDIYGSYFADYECSIGSRGDLSRNTVIYGHSDLKDNPAGPRFSQLFAFADAAFAAQHDVVEFSSPGERMRWRVFAVFYTDVSFDYLAAEPSDGQMAAMLAQARELSLHEYAPAVPEDRILTLSTCAMARADLRFVVMAALLPAGEQPDGLALAA